MNAAFCKTLFFYLSHDHAELGDAAIAEVVFLLFAKVLVSPSFVRLIRIRGYLLYLSCLALHHGLCNLILHHTIK
ncbi:hypothetical protein LZ30DRAFT_712600 [Colletotrichum cereale]|nr:hypothetical protein LZ30DRAFT_712600 [Colletotrichum cereale]